MKRLVVAVLVLTAIAVALSRDEREVDISCVVESIQRHNRERLIDAIMYVESRYNTEAYCKREDAAGVLQIRPIMVREVNRILRLSDSDKRFTNEDRWSRDKSVEMFNIYADYHLPSGTSEQIARAWNGGPKGHKRSSTIKYWNKVKHKLTKQ